MTNSIRRARKFSRSGVAAASAVSLALGAFSVVGPGPLASAAEEEAGEDTSLTGGIRGTDGSGVINAGDQLESDLGAGSCMVASAEAGGSETGSQAGFSWDRLEPSTATTDKRTWGVSVAFDNSRDRTFASWEWNSSSLRTVPVTFGSVPAAPAGEPLGPDITASDQADEQLTINSGFQFTYGLRSDLSEDEVTKFAQAGASSPVRYVWKTQYTKDNFTNPNLQATNQSNFIALVNPWPNENNECNPIKVDWVGIKQHVIEPGKDTKVGHITVPALSNGSVDDSLSRMVVEAYDGNGEYIASSDTGASNGGKQLLRVDANGDIYFTWPEYRGTDLAAQQNVHFSVVAKPRTTGELEAAHASSGWYGPDPQVFDSSNSLPRYSKANEIGRNTISLDDTEYHDPKYNTDEQTITSGIETDGSLTDQPQGVVFKQVPDLIRDLVKEKGNDGFEAKVVLDQRYVFEGWTAEMDPETYDVTVTSPSNPKPGTFAQPRVVVEYSNGSKDELSLLVIVDPNHTQITDLVRPGVAKGQANKDVTSQITTKSIMNGYDPVAPATFEVDQSTVPAGWTVTVDNTGKVTAIADDTVVPGTIITPKVTAKYPDGTTDEIEPQFQAIVDIKIPDYDTVTNKPGTDVSLTPTVPEVGLTGNASDEAPTRYTFEDEKTELTIEDGAGTWTVKIDEATGEITTTIPRTAPEGHILNIPVLAHYSNVTQNKPQRIKGTVVVLKSDVAPNYTVESTGPNQAVDHQIQYAPKGSTFSLNLEPNEDGELVTEDGWKYTIDPDTGVVSATPPAGSKPGDKKTIIVDVETPDGSIAKVPVTTVVQLTNNWEAEPSYPAETVYPGETATSPLTIQKPEGVKVAEENPYAIQPADNYVLNEQKNEFGNPTYTVTTENGNWIVGLDDKGNVVATAPETAKPGDSINVPVKVTYSDKSTDDVTASIVVEDNPKRPVPFDVEYKYDPKVPAGEYRVETEGKPGEEKQNQDGKWEQTTAPTNEVVIIGTMPAENTQELEWTVPIPYSTTLRENKALAPGEIKVVQEGVYGERNYTAKFRSVGGESYVVTSDDAKEPVEEIIEYGPTIADQTLTSTTTNPVPFNTTFVADPNLPAGEQVVDKQGVNGVDTITSTQEIKDGKPVGEPTITTQRTTEPQDAVIRVGTKTEGQTTKTVEADVPFGVKIEFDPNMPAGTSETVTEGKPGKKTITVTQKVTNSQPDGEATVEEKITEQPVDQVIKVGTKPSEASEKVSWTAQVPFEVETRPNPELKPGEIKVAQKGVPGEKTYTADFTAKGDQATVTPEEKQTKDPVTQIIEYGPAAEDTSVVTKTEKPVPFETEIVFDDTLAEGEQVVDQQGEHGSEVVTSTQQIVDGKPSGDPTVTTERTKEPVKQIIRVGTKTAGQTVNTYEAAIPFPVRVVYDPNLAPGESKVTQEGKPGTKKITITQPVVNSAPNGEATVAEETVTEPTEQIVTVGTKPDEATNTVTWTVDVPFKTVVRANPELKPGDIKTVQEGEYGEKKFTADFSSVGADSKVDTKEEQTKEPKDQIIEYGPTIDDQTLTSTTTNPVPFNTTFVADPNLPVGQQVVDKQGENGVDTVTSTQEIKDGKPVGEPKISTERTKEPVNAVVRVGTKTDSTNDFEYKEPVPYETKIEYDPTLAAGEYQVVTPGKAGEKTVKVTETIVNSKVTDTERDEEITTQPVTQVIKVGTKQPTAGEQVTWTEPIPFQTTFRENPDLAPGETKVVQEGKDGEATYRVEFNSNGESATVENTNQRVEPVERIVEYGPRANDDEISSQVTRPVEFKTSVIYDDTLEEGKQVITQGELGEEVVTTTQKLVDGKPSGEPVTSTEITKAPKNAVIRIGTKKPGTPDPAPEVSEVVDLPFTTKIIYDPTLEPGQEIEDVAGADGQVKVTVVNGKATVETVKEPVQRVVRVGTKPAGDVEWTEEIPFKVQVRENPELTREQSRIAQEGVPGLKQVVNGNEQIVREPVDYILEVGTKATDEKPQYSPVALQPGQTADIQPANAVKGNKYRKLDWPKGWEGTVDPDTGQVRVTTPADAKPGDKAKLPIDVTDENGNTYTVYTEVIVSGKDVAPAPEPDTKTSSDKAKRCVSNAFAKNSPILWMLPVALLGAVGYGVNEAFGPQIQQATAQINEQIRRSMPDLGIGRGIEQPEWVREINAQVDAINRQFAPVAKQLEPIGIALGAIAAISLTGMLIAQACTEEGFDNGLTVLSSEK
ncbi:hypothetical protein A0K93_08750 [Corynebacterium sp. BCW_4722]|nr:hypothetical protein A0K93_08750 [Corynebacterium sp. BCW_4722]